MRFDIYLKLKEKPIYTKFIRENSHWYKILNRDPSSFSSFIEKVKEEYHLRPIDRINKTIDAIDMVSTIISTLNS